MERDPAMELERFEEAAQSVAREILQRIESRRPADYLERLGRDPLVGWSRRGHVLLAKVLRFVDVCPAASTDAELLECLRAYVGEAEDFLAGPETPAPQAAGAVRVLVRALRMRFTAGETLDDGLAVCAALRQAGCGFTLDILGEAVNSEKEAEAYLAAYLDLFRRASAVADSWPPCPGVDRDGHGAVPRVNVSVKLSSLYSRFDAIDPGGSFEGTAPRLRALFRAARESGASVNVDMEQYALKDLTLNVFTKVLMEEEFRAWPDASITIQTYLPEHVRDLKDLVEWAGRRGTPVNIRLVKGAYWDHEVQNARYRNWPVPVYEEKEQTDAAFEAACRYVLANVERLRPAVAGHNVRGASHAIAVAERLGLPGDAVEFQTLYGLGEELGHVLVEMGRRVRVYVPFGRTAPGLAYLVRRLLEATSRSAFLRQMWPSPLPVDELAARPRPNPVEPARASPRRAFENEPATDFSREGAREAMTRALEDVRARLGAAHRLWLGGPVECGDQLVSVNPGRKREVVGRVCCASPRHGAMAVRVAAKAFTAWRETPAEDRAALLLRAAERMRARRFELAAWEILEVGKSWREADADVAEAIDCLEFYAREAVRLAQARHRNVHGEDNAYFYEPRGVAVAITPWNFPLAILTGVACAAVAAGNAVIMKPAGPSSVVGAKLMEVWNEAGAPPGVVQFLPGRGRELGEYLVRHPGVHVIGFTGSLSVGLRLQSLAARVRPGQTHVKRVIAEMGGKNAVIVDRDADLDQAVPGIVVSAFGYQGQKCSACSRVIAHRDCYGALLERLVDATRSLPIGPAWDPHCAVGPLIHEAACEKVREYIARGKDSARVAYEADVGALADEGFYVGPVIFMDVDPGSALATDEIFGPVLCVMRAGSFSDAVAMANATGYGLTGGLYSRNPDHIRRAPRELLAGNLYVNRPITGALVDRQPFGGLRLSGVGSKAGGPDYLLQFMQPKTFSEWTVRRGFAPPA